MIDNKDVAKIMDIARRRRAMLILPFVIVLILSASVAFLLPSIYRSTGVIMIKYAQIPANLVPSTVTSYADQRIQAITEEVMARSKILSLVQKYDLLPARRANLSTEELVDEIRDRIILEPIDAKVKKKGDNSPVPLTIAFKVSYEDENPKKAQLMANEIASFFVQKSLETREKHAKNTTRFLEDQLKNAKAKLDGLETRLAAYRQAHLEELPDFSALDLQKIEKFNSDISSLNMQSRSLEEQRARIKDQLASIDPHSFPNKKVMSPEERLQLAKLQLAELLSRYSDKYPLVEAKKKEIAILERTTRQGDKLTQARERLQKLNLKLAGLRSRYTDAHPDVQKALREIEGVKKEIAALHDRGVQPGFARIRDATNPNYVSLKTQLDGIQASLDSIRIEKANLEKKIDQVYAKLHKMPQVSKEYNQINTDYQDAKIQYTELQHKSMAAKVGQGMEEEQLGETFQLMDPPFLPEQPVSPNRLAIILIGVVLGISLSVGGTCVREYTDDDVRDVKTLADITGIPVFSVIPRIITDEDKSRLRKKRIFLTAGTACAFLILICFVNFFVMDLYVMYAKAIRVLAKYIPV